MFVFEVYLMLRDMDGIQENIIIRGIVVREDESLF